MNGRRHTEGGNKDSPLHIFPSFSHLSIYADRKPLNRVGVDYVRKRTMACHRGLRTFGKLPPGVFRNQPYASLVKKSSRLHENSLERHRTSASDIRLMHSNFPRPES